MERAMGIEPTSEAWEGFTIGQLLLRVSDQAN